MAWIKFKNVKGEVYSVPESVYNSMFAGNDGFTLMKESKPAPINEKTEKEEIKQDEQIQQPNADETIAVRKNTKKANS